MDRTVSYPVGTDIDAEDFRQAIRAECHYAGYEVIDFGYSGHDGKPYVTFRKRPERNTSKPKARFFE